MKKTFLIYFIAIFSLAANAQKINILIPDNANKEYAFILNKGILADTIQKGHFSFAGDITINIPARNKDYLGMGSLLVKDGPTMNFIIDKNNFKIEQGADKKLKFENSAENKYLYSIMQDGITPQADTTLYAYKFVNLIRYMQQLNGARQSMNLGERAGVRNYALEKLDMEMLYTSSLWYHVIDGIVNFDADQQTKGEDMVKILKRIKSQEVFEHLADNLIVITGQFGWDDAFDIIIPYVEESGRIKVPQGKMFDAFAMAKVRRGLPAPDIVGLTPSMKDSAAKATLLIFYQSSCENCHIQLEKLIKIYPELNQKGIRVVSISADYEKASFEYDKDHYPWADKLCDFEGFTGKNFMNYGILGTPTFFLIDKDQKVIRRYALIDNIDFSESINSQL